MHDSKLENEETSSNDKVDLDKVESHNREKENSMDKNELIERLEELESDHQVDDYSEGFDDGIVVALELAEQLEEPEKPVVPSFVADWFEENKDDLDYEIFSLNLDIYEKDKRGNTISVLCDSQEMLDWANAPDDNKPIETLVKMKLYGYEVKKEKPQVIKVLENLYLAEPLGDTASHRIITTWDLGSAYKFTD